MGPSFKIVASSLSFVLAFSSCQHPKLIETFRGKVIVDIAAGGSHSAAIGENGELYTWGKGRYGRLGIYYMLSYKYCQ